MKTTPTTQASAFLQARQGRVLIVALACIAGSTLALAQTDQSDQNVNPAEEFAGSFSAKPDQTDPAMTEAAVGQAINQQPKNNKKAAPLPKEGLQVKVDDNMTVDLHVKDEDLANVLEMLSIQSQKNIIASKDVSARVTANLYGVTFYEALDAVLGVNGYGFMEEGNFIKIYTLEELTKLNAAARQKVSKVLDLNYLTAVDAAEFVKPLLSNEGQIKVNGKAMTFPAFAEVPVGGEDYSGGAKLVVYDFEEHVAQVEAMLKQLDSRPQQVLIEATVLQTQLTEANALGVDFSVLVDATSAVTLGQITDAKSVISNVGDVTLGKGGLKVGVASGDVSILARLLDEVSNTTVVANPKLLTLNRMPARVLVGRKVGYLNTTSTDTATTQSVEFLDTGTQLYVRPFVTNDGLIRLELKPQVSEAAIRTIATSNGAPVTIPDEITNELATNVLVRDGQTVVLGGLFREATTLSRKQIPFLGDLPIIGHAFRGQDDDTNRNEIIFLVTPQIVSDAAMSNAGQRGKAYVEAAVTGSREGTLYWSREKLTNGLNVEAERRFREGDTKGALNKIDRSLSLNSAQPGMVVLREQINGSRTAMTGRSFLEHVLSSESSKLHVNHDPAMFAPSAPVQSQSWNQNAAQPQQSADMNNNQFNSTNGQNNWQNNWQNDGQNDGQAVEPQSEMTTETNEPVSFQNMDNNNAWQNQDNNTSNNNANFQSASAMGSDEVVDADGNVVSGQPVASDQSQFSQQNIAQTQQTADAGSMNTPKATGKTRNSGNYFQLLANKRKQQQAVSTAPSDDSK